MGSTRVAFIELTLGTNPGDRELYSSASREPDHHSSHVLPKDYEERAIIVSDALRARL